MENRIRVLVACEFSGVVRDAFRVRGHDAWSCDLLPDMNGNDRYHIEIDILDLLRGVRNWDLMIAHPPCTYLTNAGVRHLNPKVLTRAGTTAKTLVGKARWDEMIKACDFFNALQNADIPRICVENPVPHGYARERIGWYNQIIQPWMFGCGETKATCLWLKNLPELKPTNIVSGRTPRVHHESPIVIGGLTRAQRRSITVQGIADAMADQWGSLSPL